MKPIILIQTFLCSAVIAIGLFMIVRFVGVAVPPVLSGVAFILIGVVQLLKK